MLLQIALTFLLTLAYVAGTTPPGFRPKEIKQQDKNGPKYNYGYKISNDKGTQEKQEQRDGIYALGRYYVQGAGASQTVEYLADDWGYHPFIEYSNITPHSKSTTQIAFGEEAVKALHNNQKNNGNLEFNQNPIYLQPTAQTTQQANAIYRPAQHAQTINLSNQKDNTIFVQNHHDHQILQQQQIQQQQQQVQLQQQVQQHQQIQLQQQIQQQNVKFEHKNKDNTIYINHQPKTKQLQTKQEYHQNHNYFNQKQHQHLLYPQLQYNHQQAEQSKVYVTDQQVQPGIVYINHQQPNNQIYQNVPTQQPLPQDQQNVLYVTPQQDNLILLPQQNYNNEAQYQNMYLVQINDQPLIQPLAPQQEIKQYEETKPTAAALVQNYQPEIKQSAGNNIEEEYFPNQGGYGTKINAKLVTNKLRTSKLIQTTKDLVTGEDVLNINDVLIKNQEESSTAKAIANEYIPNYTNEVVGSSTAAPITASTERISFVTTEKVNEISLSKEPIVVAELDENNLGDYDEEKEKVYSTTQSTVETVKTVTGFDSTEATVVVTPRPVSTTFLAPITAGVRLQSVEENEKPKSNVVVEIQKSVPYYLGKFEFIPGPNGYVRKENNNTENNYNMELGKSLLQYSVETLPQPEALIREVGNVRNGIEENLQHVAYANIDQTQESGQVNYQYQPPYQQVLVPNSKPNYQVDISKENVEEKHVEVTKYIDRPYPVEVAVPHPVPYPVEIEKIVEKVVNKPYPVEVRVPIEVPVQQTVEKIVEKKVPVEVQVPVPQPFYVEVPKPYPVQVTKLIPQPYPVTVTKTVKVPVPTPVEVKVPHPVPVEVPKYIERPYPIYINKDKHHNNPYSYAPGYQIPCNNPNHHHHHKQHQQQLQIQQHQIQQHQNKYNKNLSYLPIGGNFYHTIHLNDYLGLKPPKLPHKFQSNLPRKHRNARHSFGQNLRIEYGFMPPLIPSIEIDENGKPIEKSD